MFNRILSNLTGSANKNNNDSDNTLKPPVKGLFIQKIDEIPEVFAEKINDIILKEEFYQASHFLGGDFNIEYIDENTYTCYCKFYFRGKDNSTYDLETKKQRLDIARISEEAKKELQDSKIIKYDITEPSAEIRRKYTLHKS